MPDRMSTTVRDGLPPGRRIREQAGHLDVVGGELLFGGRLYDLRVVWLRHCASPHPHLQCPAQIRDNLGGGWLDGEVLAGDGARGGRCSPARRRREQPE